MQQFLSCGLRIHGEDLTGDLQACHTSVVLPALQGWKCIRDLRADRGLDPRGRVPVPEGSCFHFLLKAATLKKKKNKQKGSAAFSGAPAAKGSVSSLCTGSSTACGDHCCDSPVIIIPIPFLKAQLGSRKKSQKRQLHTRMLNFGMVGSSRNPMRCKEWVLPRQPLGFAPVTPRETQPLGVFRIWTCDVTHLSSAPQLCREQQGDNATPIAPLLAARAGRQDAE